MFGKLRKLRLGAALLASATSGTLMITSPGCVGSNDTLVAPAGDEEPEAPLSTDVSGDVSILACSHPAWSDKDLDGYGYVKTSYGSAPIHDGPYGACTTTNHASSTQKLYYHCYVVNSYGNTWTHLRIAGTSIMGWVWDEYLNDNGSLYPC